MLDSAICWGGGQVKVAGSEVKEVKSTQRAGELELEEGNFTTVSSPDTTRCEMLHRPLNCRHSLQRGAHTPEFKREGAVIPNSNITKGCKYTQILYVDSFTIYTEL